MKPHKSISPFLLLFVGAIALIVLGNRVVSNHVLPSLNEFIASSTTSTDGTDYISPSTASNTPERILYLPSPFKIKTDKTTIVAQVATTTEVQGKGLGGITSLPAHRGMLFIFQQPDVYGFWMKDTLVPLDMVWIDVGGRVAGVTSNISTTSYPKIFLPPENISYVLELNAGEAQKDGIATDTMLTF